MTESAPESAALVALAATPELFAAWLRAQAPSEIVGTAARALRCPYATYLRATCGNADAFAYVDGDTLMLDETWCVVPGWLSRFIDEIDGLASISPDEDSPATTPRVTARQAMYALGCALSSATNDAREEHREGWE